LSYLFSAKIVDSCRRIASVAQVFFELQAKWNIALLQYQGLCQLFPVLFLTAQHLSPLLVLAFTTERYVSVCHPFARERFWSTRRPLATVGVLASFALAINVVQAYFWNYNPHTGDCALRDEVCPFASVRASSQWAFYDYYIIIVTSFLFDFYKKSTRDVLVQFYHLWTNRYGGFRRAFFVC
jgi:hypothetical protein